MVVGLTERKGCEHGSLLGSDYTCDDFKEFKSASEEWVFVSSGNMAICHCHDQ